jgi:CHAT domain-containing protein
VEANYNNFLQDVVEKYPELSVYFTRSNADEFNNYKSKLPEDLAVLLYLLNNNTLMIFSLTREKLSVDTMTVDVTAKVNAFIEAIKNTSKQTGTGALAVRSEPVDEEKPAGNIEFKDLSGQLYNMLVTTVADKINGKKKLCIIPTGVFSNMPFQCLGKKTVNNGFKFLIEDYSIFYTNKMSVFNTGEREIPKITNMNSFAAFGVPDATLSFNINEVKEIGKILGSDSTVYSDARATESMAKQSLRNKKYIHFATHGVLNYSSDYSQSYLKLLPDKDTSNGNNGQLTMREIQGLGISDCNMVILSACQTAVSKALVKGWNISPANSFLVSNVKTVVASLWKVADEPTGLLMQYFYENLSSPASVNKVDALRLAQVKLSHDPRFSHPNYWGAFVLYGDWR